MEQQCGHGFVKLAARHIQREALTFQRSRNASLRERHPELPRELLGALHVHRGAQGPEQGVSLVEVRRRAFAVSLGRSEGCQKEMDISDRAPIETKLWRASVRCRPTSPMAPSAWATRPIT